MITIKKETTASFDVDPQNGFSELCPNELPVAGATDIVPFLNQNATYASIRVMSKDAHSKEAEWVVDETHPILSAVESESPDIDVHWNSHCNVGTFGFEAMAGLPHVRDYDFIVYKGAEKDMHPYGACYHDLGNTMTTGVIEFLTCKNIDTVIVGGLATDYCVANTAKQLKNAGFSVILNLESCRGIAEESIASAIQEMKDLGITIVNSLSEVEVK